MKTMSNVDIYTISTELNNILEGARVDKTFQPNKDTVVMRFHIAGTGRVDVVFQAGTRIHISQYPLENPTRPPSFPMLLRKRLRGSNVISVKQHHFDRIVEIKMKKDQTYTLIIELFAQGNIILLDEENNIIMPLKRKSWSDRDISSKKEYIYPPENGINPLTIEFDKFYEIISNSDSDLVRTLARNGFGSLYAEEIILKTNEIRENNDKEIIDKKTDINNLSKEDIEDVFCGLNKLFEPLKNQEFKPTIISDGKEDVVPLEISQYKEFKQTPYKTFNEACDEFYSSKVKGEITDVQERVWNKKVGKFSKRLKLQEETLENFEKTIEISQKRGELLYQYYTQIEDIINTINNARDKDYSYKDINKTLQSAKENGLESLKILDNVDKLGILNLEIEDTKISIDSRKPIPENAEVFYEKAKKSKRKIKGALIAIEKTKKQLADMESKKEKAMEHIMVPTKRVKKELKWFEKLRWFITSEGNLVLGGKDANSNENVVKKYLDNNDIYMHADIHGAPSIAIKLTDHTINDNILKESAIFAASFSTAWSKGYSNQDVFWVKPDQVSKTPEPGEFLPKGAFVIRGQRTFVRSAKLRIGVGIVDYEGKRIMAGPVDAMEKYCNKYVIIKPGYTKKEAMAKSILSEINEDNLLSLEDLVRVLPTGKCDIEKVVNKEESSKK